MFTVLYTDIWKVYNIVQNTTTRSPKDEQQVKLIMDKILVIDKQLDVMDLYSSIHIFQ